MCNFFFIIKDLTLWDYIRVFRKKKEAQNKVSCQFLSRILFKKIFDKILLDNNLTHPLKKKFSKNVYNSKRITFSKESNSLFSDYPCFSLFRFFDKVLSILKKSNANLLRNVLRLNKPENVIKKYKYTEKRVYRTFKRRQT